MTILCHSTPQPIELTNISELKKLMQSKENVFLLIHATWCGYCKRYMPTHKLIAKNLYNNKSSKDCTNLIVAMMEGDKFRDQINQVLGKDIPGFPTLVMKKADGTINFYIPDENARNLSTLLNYLMNYYPKKASPSKKASPFKKASPSTKKAEYEFKIADSNYKALLNEEMIKLYEGSKLYYEIPSYNKAFVGEAKNPKDHGNTILVHVKPNKYVYMGPEPYMFSTKEEFTYLYSPLNKMNSPQSYAIGNDSTFLFEEKVYIPNDKWEGEFDNPYDYYANNQDESEMTEIKTSLI